MGRKGKMALGAVLAALAALGVAAVLVNMALLRIGYTDNVLNATNITGDILHSMYADSVLIPAVLYILVFIVLRFLYPLGKEKIELPDLYRYKYKKLRALEGKGKGDGSRGRIGIPFGSYGWSGEAVPALTARLTGLKMQVFGEGLKVCFVPTAADLAAAQELGKDFAQSL